MVALVALLGSACVITGPDTRALVRSQLVDERVYPGTQAFPGLYEITDVQVLREHEVNDDTLDVEAEVTVRLVKDVADWVKNEGVGGLGEQGFAAYRQFRNAKAGDRFTQRVDYRLIRRDSAWAGERAGS